MHVFLHIKSFCLVVLKLILASKLSELQQFENRAANYQLASIKGRNEAKKTMPLRSFRKGAESKLRLSCTKIETGSPFLHFALGCSHLQENLILFRNRPFAARFINPIRGGGGG